MAVTGHDTPKHSGGATELDLWLSLRVRLQALERQALHAADMVGSNGDLQGAMRYTAGCCRAAVAMGDSAVPR